MTLMRSALILGLLSAVGPFAIDMYLPAMPTIAAGLDADVATVQLTLTAYFVAFGIAQLFYGPWADQVGRKIPLYVGLGIFIAGSIGCAVAPSIGALIAFRALQGIGGAVLMVVPRAVIRDMHTGAAATKLMAMVMLVISVSPMLAPLVGSGVIAVADWRVIFWLLCLAAGLSLGMTAMVLPETLAPAARVKVNLRNLMKGAKVLLTDRVFMGLTLIGGFGFASFMVFIASASFVYSGQFGLSPTGFSVAFAINAIGFFAASQAAGPLGERLGVLPVMRGAVIGFAAFSMLLLVVCLAGFVSLPVVIIGLFFANACLGLIIPTTMVMALDPHGDIAGLASSLGGTLQMLTGGLMVVVTGAFFDGTATPMVGAIALCAVIALGIALWTFAAMGRTASA
ncbi:DHA1 family bicyclomycin/chloramphenicol resistance-like MFS transporter [Loktanella ponticola]|uniref:Bcr/CflA family efflux transporter n=1 Tax=Yoonia ponticola TaxID=1524255 RepID=A0A7W9EZG5_9RHOB|nr:multidrug effflux MFS transporter [Yoonia ponticola]MBB5722125.1 DHA1 family bicyclomycin/chloramphenicol resistance-like MFS transporter [Yoonia ponticola]